MAAIDVVSMNRRLLDLALKHSPGFLLDWKEARYFRRHGEVELDLVKVLCRRDRDAIDAGANEGMYLLFMRRHARHVLAFEPHSKLHEQLCRRYARDVTLSNIALSNRMGTAVLHVPLIKRDAICGLATLDPGVAAAHPELLKLRVPIMPLDKIYDGNVGFMKIDVEGHEEALLDGAEATLKRCRPRLLIESDDTIVPGSRERVVERLVRMQYAASL